MTAKELIETLTKFNQDDVVILGDSITGWSNIEEVKQDGSCISITMGDHLHNKWED